MSYTSRETSPDPLAGPRSPMTSRINQTDASDRAVSRPRRSTRALASRSHNIASPSKSFIMDTGAAGDASPWRIKVTVEAEPHDGSSPSKRVTRTTKVPLKGSSSPARKSPKKKALLADESEVEIKRPQRKRKGTPIRRNAKRASPPREQDDEDVFTDVQPSGQIEMSKKLQEELSSPTKAPVTRSRRKGTPKPSPAERARRLSKAQSQLEAVGGSEESDNNVEDQYDEAEILQSDAALGDMTVANEDFTMVSVATLESIKQGNTSQLLENSGYGDKSAASVSYMPSSPPQPEQVQEDVSFHSNWERRGQSGGISQQSKHHNSSKDHSQHNNICDDMSWKPTGPLKTPSMLAKSDKVREQSQSRSDPAEYQLEREAVSRQIESASADEVIVVDSSRSLADEQFDEDGDDQAALGAEQPQEDRDEGGEDDIWAEEASRSLEEEQDPPPLQQQQSSTAAVLNELFSDQPSKPPRGKIPRTWRRTSGMDFSYVDSPAHEILQRPAAETRKVSATSTQSSREGDGVLTPPDSSFDEDDEKTDEQADHAEADMDLTHPDAAATQLQVEEKEPIPRRWLEPAACVSSRITKLSQNTSRDTTQLSIGSSKSSNSLSSNGSGRSNEQNDDEDTGMFWQTNLPSVFQQTRQRRWGSKLLAERRNRPKTQELSEILRSSSDVSIDQKAAQSVAVVEKSEVEIVEERATSTLQYSAKATEKVVNSPLRRSLLRSSKIGGSSALSVGDFAAKGFTSKPQSMHMPDSNSNSQVTQSESDSSIGESFESKASDQRQLLTEMNVDSTRSRDQHQSAGVDETDIWGAVSEESAVQHTMSEASYTGSSPVSRPRYTDPKAEEEPQDDKDMEQPEDEDYGQDFVEDAEEVLEHEGNHPSRSYEERLNLDSPVKIKVKFNDSEGNSSMLAPKKEYPPLFGKEEQPVERIMIPKPASSRPTTPSEQGPSLLSRLTTTIWSALIRPSGPTMVDPTPEPEFSLTLRLNIRSRYGVLSDQHPWTMAHMRTLHRLLNSCTSNKADSLVPKTGPLPAPLKCLIGKEVQCTTEFKWNFTEQHAHIVDSFMQVLVPAHYTDAIRTGEVDFIGDDFALLCRGMWGGRHGDDLVWDADTIAQHPLLRNAKGTIQRSFVVRALGNAVSANVETAEREAREKEERERIEAERRAWERKMGIVHEEEVEEGSMEKPSAMDSDEVLHHVRRE